MRADIIDLAHAFYVSFDNVSLENLTILAHDITGLNSCKNTLKNEEISVYISKALELVYKNNDKVLDVSWQLLRSEIKQAVRVTKQEKKQRQLFKSVFNE